ncbi:MAG: SAM-dependent methyltransferase [Robiginitomaculum sp.]|nr:MAG: SAM-dependent methyltransferase [Robiginitomaculum sp.]
MIRKSFNAFRYWFRQPCQYNAGKVARHCPICDYRGLFYAVGSPPRYDARCPNCRSRERHRLVHLYFEREGVNPRHAGPFLHVAPEPHFSRSMAGCENYHSADLHPGRARHCADIQDLPFPDNHFDWAMANHVLEHVPDDMRALLEIFRVLKPGGRALLTVPQNWSRESTYESHEITNTALAFAHYADPLHVRFYGRDFADRLRKAGFDVLCWRLSPQEEVTYGLYREDVLYVCTKACLERE